MRSSSFYSRLLSAVAGVLIFSAPGYASITAVLQTYNGDGTTNFVDHDSAPLETNALFMVFRTTNSAGAGFNAVNPLAPYGGDVLLGAYPLAQTNFPGYAGQISGYLGQYYTNAAVGHIYLAVFDCTYVAYAASNAVPEGTRYLLTTNAPATVQDSSGGGTPTDVGQAVNDYVALHGAWMADKFISFTNAAAIGLSTQTVDFSSTYGATSAMPGVYLLYNTGNSPLRYTNDISYGSGTAGWFSLAPAGGQLASGLFAAQTGRVQIAGMNVGIYTAHVSIVSADATNSPQQVDVLLTIARAAQTITFGTIPAQFTTNLLNLSATAASGLPITYNVESGPGQLTGSQLSFTGTGIVYVSAAQAGNSNWNPAVTVTQSVVVLEPSPLGSMLCTLNPELIRTNGGCWRIQGTEDWNISGAAVTDLTPGTYQVEFQFVAGWQTPAVTGVVVRANHQTPVPVTYEKLRSKNDFDSDGLTDIGCFDPATGGWFVFMSFNQMLWTTNYAGGTGTLPVTGDFDGDGFSDYGSYYPPSGYWRIMRSTAGEWTNHFGFDGTEPVTGDFDGDGILDFGCYFAPNGGWYLFKSHDGFWENHFGYEGTVPVTGDFDGDGIDDFGCFFAPNGGWFIFKSHDGFWENNFGYAETVPVTGDFDGDGIDDFGCYYPSEGAWFIFKSREGFWTTNFGFGGTEPVTGDYDGDGIDDFGCYFPPDGGWYLYKSRDGFWTTHFGYGGTKPIK